MCLSVAVRSLHTAVLARSAREISQTVRIDCHSFLSRVHISVRPNTFSMGENRKKNECSVDRQVAPYRPGAQDGYSCKEGQNV